MNIRDLWNAGNFLTSLEVISSSKWKLNHGANITLPYTTLFLSSMRSWRPIYFVHVLYCFAYITNSFTLKWSNYYLAKIQNAELLPCAVSFQFPGGSEYCDWGNDNEHCGDEEDDENRITNNLSPYSTAVL